MKRLLVAVLFVMTAPGLAVAQQPDSSPSQPPPGVEARADQELRRMGAFLATLPRFALEAEETFDEIEDGEPRRQLTNLRRVAVERPARLAADATGDTRNRASWYDGTTMTVLDKDHDTYATVDAPAAIDAALDMLADAYGVVLPLADLFYSDPYRVLIEGVTYGRYLGLHLAADVLCHHLVFAQETIEWQIWIDAGKEPLPRKLVITYVLEEGEPQYAATIRRWSLDPQFTGDLFIFEAPEGAVRVDPVEKTASPAGGSPEDTGKGGRP